jgi:hypothetical protein
VPALETTLLTFHREWKILLLACLETGSHCTDKPMTEGIDEL